MKRFAALVGLFVFALVAEAQTTINVYQGEVPMHLRHQTQAYTSGTGCVGSRPIQASGCHGYQAGGCISRSGGGCYGYQAGGCTGYQAGWAPPPTARIRVEYEVPVAAPAYIDGIPVRMSGKQAYATGAAPYGAKLAPGEYATPSGRPPAPGVVSVPGDAFPYDGPVRRFFRRGAGYDQ
jgi:hypothetical protein